MHERVSAVALVRARLGLAEAGHAESDPEAGQHRRLRAAGAKVIALGCHPGVVYTDLFANRSRRQQLLLSPAMRIINFWAVQNARMGALPALRAATDPAARGGEYFGPRRYGLRRSFYTGYPALVESSARSHREADQARLWQVSEQLTGVSYTALS